MARLSEIEGRERGDHPLLPGDVSVYHLREYTSGRDYSHSETNRLIFNFKKPVDRRGRPEWRYEESALQNTGRGASQRSCGGRYLGPRASIKGQARS